MALEGGRLPQIQQRHTTMPTILLSSLFIFTVSIHVLISQAASTRIIPAPQTVLAQEGKFKITSSTRIILGGETTPRDRFAAALINETLREWKDVTLRIISEESVRRISSNFLDIARCVFLDSDRV